MDTQAIKELIADYKALGEAEIHSFAAAIRHNNELIASILSVFEDVKHKKAEYLEQVCETLFSFYRSTEVELQRFSLQYIPSLIGLYLVNFGLGVEKKNLVYVEVLLLAIYNLEVVDSGGKPKTQSFRIPSLLQPSLYHDPFHLNLASALTERNLLRLEKGGSQTVTIGPHTAVERFNNSNRFIVLRVLLNLYNRNLSFMPKASLQTLCKMCSRIVSQGYPKTSYQRRMSLAHQYGVAGSSANTSTETTSPPQGTPTSAYTPADGPRLALSQQFLVELTYGIYFAMFNGIAGLGMAALEDVHCRAMHDLYPEVLLMTNSIRNSMRVSSTGSPMNGPLGLSIAMSPTAVPTTLSKSTIITNASFKARKLPDDIPITDKDGNVLQSINEEDQSGPGSTIVTSATNTQAPGHDRPGKGKERKTPALVAGVLGKIGVGGEKSKVGKKDSLGDANNKQESVKKAESKEPKLKPERRRSVDAGLRGITALPGVGSPSEKTLGVNGDLGGDSGRCSEASATSPSMGVKGKGRVELIEMRALRDVPLSETESAYSDEYSSNSTHNSPSSKRRSSSLGKKAVELGDVTISCST